MYLSKSYIGNGSVDSYTSHRVQDMCNVSTFTISVLLIDSQPEYPVVSNNFYRRHWGRSSGCGVTQKEAWRTTPESSSRLALSSMAPPARELDVLDRGAASDNTTYGGIRLKWTEHTGFQQRCNVGHSGWFQRATALRTSYFVDVPKALDLK